MDETRFQYLSAEDRHDALQAAQAEGPRPAFLLEKDIWVVATLDVLFDAPFGKHLVFKGGTSLSKAWGAIHRFSEDIDITYDIRAMAPDLVAHAGAEVIPPTRSQQKRWAKTISARLAEWVGGQAAPFVGKELGRVGFSARVRTESERLYIGYDPLFSPLGTIRPEVKVDFGARSTGEPHASHKVACYAATCLPGIVFPEAHPSVMLAERTFWEKATAIHVYCHQGRRRGDGWSRHWHDLVRLDEAGIANRALADRELALSVARHKDMFFREKDSSGQLIHYKEAVAGNLRLVPEGTAQEVLATDYDRMRRSGMLPGVHESFEELMARCTKIEARANTRLNIEF